MFGELTPQEIEETIYSHTHEGMKVKMMRNNPKVCFEVDILQNMANWKSVIAWGEFEELTNSAIRNHALQHLLDRILPIISSATTKISPEWPFVPADINSIKGIVFRIRLNQKTGRFENSMTPSFMSWG